MDAIQRQRGGEPARISSRKPCSTACSTGPPGGAAAISTGSGTQGPTASMRRQKPAISSGMQLDSARASAVIASPRTMHCSAKSS